MFCTKNKLEDLCDIYVLSMFQQAHLIVQANGLQEIKYSPKTKVFLEKILKKKEKNVYFGGANPPKLSDIGKHFWRVQFAWKVAGANISLENIST